MGTRRAARTHSMGGPRDPDLPPRHDSRGRCRSEARRGRRAAEHPRRDDRRHGRVRSRVDAERAAPPGEEGHHVHPGDRLVPALLSGARDLHHRPVRAQPRGRRKLLSVRLVRDGGPGQHAARLAAGCGLPHGPDRKVAERLRSGRRPRRGARWLRHLARAPRCLGVRLLQLRDEPERRAADLGGRGVRPQPRRVRRDRGDPQPRRPARACSPSWPRSSGRPRTTTGAPRTPTTTRSTSPAGSPRT